MRTTKQGWWSTTHAWRIWKSRLMSHLKQRLHLQSQRSPPHPCMWLCLSPTQLPREAPQPHLPLYLVPAWRQQRHLKHIVSQHQLCVQPCVNPCRSCTHAPHRLSCLVSGARMLTRHLMTRHRLTRHLLTRHLLTCHTCCTTHVLTTHLLTTQIHKKNTHLKTRRISMKRHLQQEEVTTEPMRMPT